MIDETDPTLDEILPGLFLSGYKKAERYDLLRKYGITHVLTLCEDVPPPFPTQFTYCVHSIDDSQEVNIRALLSDTNIFIDQALTHSGRVLVHCLMGISRSATAVIAYVMWKKHMRFAEAFAFVKRKHQDTDPNAGFILQLKDFQCALFPEDEAQFRRCKCGVLLFHTSEILTHGNESCSRFFVKLADWMRAWGGDGVILCYMCKMELGRYANWVGLPCACGKHWEQAYFIDEVKL
jgi:hypothetical protein